MDYRTNRQERNLECGSWDNILIDYLTIIFKTLMIDKEKFIIRFPNLRSHRTIKNNRTMTQ